MWPSGTGGGASIMVSFGLRASDHGLAHVSATPRAADAQAPRPRYFWSPLLDFLCLGGASFLLLPVLLLLPEKELQPSFAAAALLIAHVVNHPHFAVSYQIFYRGFRAKAFGGPDAGLRARYVFAGIVVPVAVAAFLAWAIAVGDARVLGLGANAMGFLVGWHYVKQGYGMLMVDAALKRRFFTMTQKHILLVNAYAVWALTWLMANVSLAERTLWGIPYVSIHIPTSVLGAAGAVALATTAGAIVVLAQAWRAGAGLPVNGVVAYLVSLYLWMLFVRMSALWLLIVPALHSLQYLVVAGRYQVNRVRAETPTAAGDPVAAGPVARLLRARRPRRLAGFAALAVVLGLLGFWAAPILANAFVPYDSAALGTMVFLFASWVFINVHHYFLDSVMWRSRNPDVKRFLFS